MGPDRHLQKSFGSSDEAGVVGAVSRHGALAGYEEMFAAPGRRHSDFSRRKPPPEAGILTATGDLRLGR
jgi:hypothetical protein